MNYIRILGKKNFMLSTDKILLLKANINYTIIHTTDGQEFVSSRTLKVYENKLSEFIRANRNELLNKNHIISFYNPNIVVLSNGVEISVSRRRLECFK